MNKLWIAMIATAGLAVAGGALAGGDAALCLGGGGLLLVGVAGRVPGVRGP